MKHELRLDGVCKRFSSNVIFNQADLSLQAGRIYGLVGPNGCGKTVLLKMICGLMTPDRGRITYDGDLLTRANVSKVNIGISIEKPQFIEDISVIDNLRFLAGFRKIICEKTICDYLRQYGLYETRNAREGALSMGMKQKLSIVQAIMEDPAILLLDEVSNSLDNQARELLFECIKREKESQKIIIYVNHNIDEVMSLADEIWMVRDRRLKLWEKSAEVY